MTADYVPPAEAVEAFKRAWHEADAEGDTGNRVLRGLTAAGPLIEQAVRDRMRAAGPTLEIHAYGATPEQADAIFTAAMDAAYDAAPEGVAVDAVGKLAGRASPEGDTR